MPQADIDSIDIDNMDLSKIDPDVVTKISEKVRNFWAELERSLKHKPTGDGMSDVIDMYAHLSPFISADAERNEQHREMLERALAIRNAY